MPSRFTSRVFVDVLGVRKRGERAGLGDGVHVERLARLLQQLRDDASGARP